MAGSLAHIVSQDDGTFTMDFIENLGDAHEALEECFYLIKELTNGGYKDTVNSYCRKLGFPEIETDLTGTYDSGWDTRG